VNVALYRLLMEIIGKLRQFNLLKKLYKEFIFMVGFKEYTLADSRKNNRFHFMLMQSY
jgi:hypothetical protein